MKKSELAKLDNMRPADLSGYLAINAAAKKSFMIAANADDEIVGVSVDALEDSQLYVTSSYEKISDLVINDLIINKDDCLVPSDPNNPQLDELDQKQENELKNIICLSASTVSELFQMFKEMMVQ